MVARHYYKDSGGSTIELTDRILREGWTVVEKAEEGSVGSSTVMVADPSMDIDIDAHRAYWIIEDDSEADDDFLFGGFTGNQKISRGHRDEMGYQPFGRTWSVQVDDKNAFWQRRAMIGSDCNRPHETDVARMAWLLGTSEASIVTDTSLVLGAGGTNMDKNDYRRQMLIQVEEDAAMVKGRNWWLTQRRVSGTPEISAWYNRGSVTAYSSPLYLSNDSGDWADALVADGTSLVWPIDDDAELDRDGTRVYSGVVQEYEGGAVYRTRSSTATAFAKRDMISPGGNIRTKTKAIARAERQLDDCDTQDERITVTVELPAAKATMLRAGMRVPFKATHLPGYSGFRWVRVLQTTITPIAAGTRYRIGLILQGPGTAGSAGFCALDPSVLLTPSGTFPPIGGTTTDASGNIWYTNSNHAYFASHAPQDGPNPGASCWGLGFAAYGSGGSTDIGGSLVQNTIAFVFAGAGTATIHTAVGSGTIGIEVNLYHLEGTSTTVTDDTQTGTAGDTFTVTTGALPGDATSCYRWIEIIIGGPGGGSAGFSGIDWVAS